MTLKNSFKWRKGLVLSATFLLSVLVIVSCKKKENLIGTNTINQNDLLSSAGIDTFSLFTYTLNEDSIIANNGRNVLYGILGSYNDPVFGDFTSEIYTQLHLSLNAPDFGDLNTIAIDSFVLGLQYANSYGVAGTQTIEVFEITDADGLSEDSVYYSFSTLQTSGPDLVPLGENVIDMDPDGITNIGGDTVLTQLRIPLDTNLARTFLDDSQLLPASFATSADFVEYFKGIHIRTANGAQAPGEGGAFYFDMAASLSKATIYYTQDGLPKEFDFLINGDVVNFNHVDIDNTGTNVETVINTPTAGMAEFYAQAFGNRAVISIPGLSDIPANAIIHSAILEMPIQYQTGADYSPGTALSVSRRVEAGGNDLIFTGLFATYDDFNKEFSVDLRSHVQRIVNGEVTDTDLILSPISFITSADRVIFNGNQTGNKVAPKIRILYTVF
ncbi:MAG: hypothetical protein ACI837_001382 [Crocinitomicaceae bacterium]|jgi:hypothetical protein